MYLIDTNVISEIRKGARCDSNVSAWFSGVTDAGIFLSVLTLGEMRRGAERVRDRDPQQCAILERWIQVTSRRYATNILPVSEVIADAWGQMHYIRNVPVVDGLLAATAKAHNLILVTRNIQHFQGLSVNLLNPFSPTTGGN